jgi:hypothetical protein
MTAQWFTQRADGPKLIPPISGANDDPQACAVTVALGVPTTQAPAQTPGENCTMQLTPNPLSAGKPWIVHITGLPGAIDFDFISTPIDGANGQDVPATGYVLPRYTSSNGGEALLTFPPLTNRMSGRHMMQVHLASSVLCSLTYLVIPAR